MRQQRRTLPRAIRPLEILDERVTPATVGPLSPASATAHAMLQFQALHASPLVQGFIPVNTTGLSPSMSIFQSAALANSLIRPNFGFNGLNLSAIGNHGGVSTSLLQNSTLGTPLSVLPNSPPFLPTSTNSTILGNPFGGLAITNFGAGILGPTSGTINTGAFGNTALNTGFTNGFSPVFGNGITVIPGQGLLFNQGLLNNGSGLNTGVLSTLPQFSPFLNNGLFSNGFSNNGLFNNGLFNNGSFSNNGLLFNNTLFPNSIVGPTTNGLM